MALFMYNLYEAEEPYTDAGEADFDAVMAQHRAFSTAIKEAGGRIVAGEALQGIKSATFLRNTTTPEVETIDNPLPEVTEVLGGFYLVDLANEQLAIELGKQAPAGHGYVEVRPIWVLP
jgi:hypothetical protein